MKNTPSTSSAPSEEGAEFDILIMPRRIVEPVILAFVLLTAVGFLWGSFSIKSFSDDAVGAQTFPAALAVLLILITGAAIFTALRLPANQTVQVKRPGWLVVTMLLLLAFPALVELVGYYILIVPWVLTFGWAARVRSPFLIGITIATVLFVAVVIFQIILGTPLP